MTISLRRFRTVHGARVRALALGALGFALALGPATTAAAAVEVAHAHGVRAVFTYRGSYPAGHGLELTIERSGVVVYHGPVRSAWCGDACWPNLVAGQSSALRVVRLDAGVDVLLSLYTGGAHCCVVEQVYAASPTTGRYVVHERDFGDAAVRLVASSVPGEVDLLSADDAFAYAFTDYAASGLPIEIIRFVGGHFVNVTRSFPTLVARDASQWLADFRSQASSHYTDTVGLAAAWAADEATLGHWAVAKRFLDQQARAGHLNSALGPYEPSGARFVGALERFLRERHYLG